MDDARDPHRRILDAVRAIPRGRVASYGQIARRAGLPGRARLVGHVLRQAGERDLPWHRVLRADGRIALPAGSAGFDAQQRRLRREGVTVTGGRVDLAAFGPGEDLDALLWGPPPAARPR